MAISFQWWPSVAVVYIALGPMNARRIHTLMREHFPVINTVEHEWINIADAEGLREAQFQDLLNQFFTSAELLVEVHRRVGKALPMSDVASFVAEHLGQGQIQISDRNFTSFAVVAANGVATAWAKPRTEAGVHNA